MCQICSIPKLLDSELVTEALFWRASCNSFHKGSGAPLCKTARLRHFSIRAGLDTSHICHLLLEAFF